MYSGLRIGETLALTYNDIDLKNKRIHINKTLTKNIETQDVNRALKLVLKYNWGINDITNALLKKHCEFICE